MSRMPLVETIDNAPDARDRQVILDLLDHDNRARSSIIDESDIAVLLRDPESADVIGGLWAEDDFAWVFVKYLFVPQDCRGLGLGARLMREVEGVARARGRVGVWLNTFDFQSRGFYETIGYEPFGRLEGTNAENGQSFLRKMV